MALTPVSGTTSSAVTLTTSGPCTDPNATNIQARIEGSGFPAGGQNVVSNSPIVTYPTTTKGGYVIPVSDTTLVALDANKNPLTKDPLLTKGQQITVKAAGFVPGESVTVVLASTPTTLAPGSADAAGMVTYPFTVPTGLADGNHSLTFTGSRLTAAYAFHVGTAATTVGTSIPGTTGGVSSQAGGGTGTGGGSSGVTTGSSTSLPRTGANTWMTALWALFLLWAGIMVVLYVGPARGVGRHAVGLARGRNHASRD